MQYRYSVVNLQPCPTFFAGTSTPHDFALQTHVYYGEEMWLQDEEIYNPKARKTEIKFAAK
jgi:hypothetical protein